MLLGRRGEGASSTGVRRWRASPFWNRHADVPFEDVVRVARGVLAQERGEAYAPEGPAPEEDFTEADFAACDAAVAAATSSGGPADASASD